MDITFWFVEMFLSYNGSPEELQPISDPEFYWSLALIGGAMAILGALVGPFGIV